MFVPIRLARRIAVALSLIIIVGCLAPNACAQSLWDKLKQQAKKAKQQTQAPSAQGSQAQNSTAGGKSAANSATTDPTGPFTAPAGTRIDTALMAPFQQGAPFAVSPHGVHVASEQLSGSRQVIVRDGVAGPKFDRLLPSSDSALNHPVVFSPDGNRWAYCGLQGSEWVVMLDGKELVRQPVPTDGTINFHLCDLSFTRNSKHLFFLSMQAPDRSPYGRLFWDGKPGPYGAPTDKRFYAISPDGDHFAYVWKEPVQNSFRWQLYIDNQPAAYNAGAPQWTADSKHLYTVLNVRDSRGGASQEALYDGKPFMRAENVDLFLAPAGDTVVARASRVGTDMKRSYFLTVGPKMVPGSETTGQIADPIFSPDGKHYAAVYTDTTNNRGWVLCDGKRGQTYLPLQGQGAVGKYVSFTADSSRIVYTASTLGSGSGTGAFVVINEQESDALMPFTSLVFSAAGNHVATTGGGQVTLDGKLLQTPDVDPRVAGARFLTFSPDGSHFAFLMMNRGDNKLFLDGVPQTAYRPITMGTDLSAFAKRTYIWSPDGKHIAYFCASANPANANETYLCYDDKAIPLNAVSATLANLMFSADSAHLYWVLKESGYQARIFADGKPVYESDSVSSGGLFAPETYQSMPDGSLLVLMQDDKGLERVSITPASGSSLPALFRGSQSQASMK